MPWVSLPAAAGHISCHFSLLNARKQHGVSILGADTVEGQTSGVRLLCGEMVRLCQST